MPNSVLQIIIGIIIFFIGYLISYFKDRKIIKDYNNMKTENEALKISNKEYSELNKILIIRNRKYKLAQKMEKEKKKEDKEEKSDEV